MVRWVIVTTIKMGSPRILCQRPRRCQQARWVDANNTWDYFAKDVNTGVVTYSYTQSNSILSPDGTKMLFVSSDNNLVAGDTNNKQDVFVRDLTTGSVTLVSGCRWHGGR